MFSKRELYTDNNLRQKLTTASVPVPANAAKPALIAVCIQIFDEIHNFFSLVGSTTFDTISGKTKKDRQSSFTIKIIMNISFREEKTLNKSFNQI